MNEERLVGKLTGEEKIKETVQRLNQLTQYEAQQSLAQILKVVLGTFENMKVVMDGEQIYQAFRPLDIENISL